MQPNRRYIPHLRTALVLTGTGTAGAYHAGVARALHEAGVKVDLVAGRGIGAVGAMFTAIDGGSGLWESNGVWRTAVLVGYTAGGGFSVLLYGWHLQRWRPWFCQWWFWLVQRVPILSDICSI